MKVAIWVDIVIFCYHRELKAMVIKNFYRSDELTSGRSVYFSRVALVEWKIFNQWIGRNGPYLWPARSPDLNLFDLFLLGHLKSIIYETALENEADSEQQIINDYQ